MVSNVAIAVTTADWLRWNVSPESLTPEPLLLKEGERGGSLRREMEPYAFIFYNYSM